MRVKLETELWIVHVDNEIIVTTPWIHTMDGKTAPGMAQPVPIVLRKGTWLELKPV